MIGKETMRFSLSGLLEVIRKNNFESKTANDVWIIYPSYIYDIVDELELFEQFKFDFFLSHEKPKMKSFVCSELACICFRPFLMDENDYQVLLDAIRCFNCEDCNNYSNPFVLAYSIINMP